MTLKRASTARRHVLLVGGTRGAGRIAARIFRAEGCRVSVVARKLPGKGERGSSLVSHWAADISDPAATKRVLEEICRKRKKIDCIAFFQRYRGTDDSWSGELATSLTATKQIIEVLVGEYGLRNCAIVFVGSVNGSLISPRVPLGYHVAKAGLKQMMRYFAATLGPLGIRVNSVSPGTFLKEESRGRILGDKHLAALYRRIIPLGRIGTAEEVAETISFLCGAKSSFITGQDIVVDGGTSLIYQEALGLALVPAHESAKPA